MEVRVTDIDAMAGRTPDQIETYLLAKGWQVVHTEQAAKVWANEMSYPDAEIWLPSSRQIRGYGARVATALNTLSNYENRSALDILFDLTNSMNDIQRVRTFTQGSAGTVPLGDIPLMADGLKRWITASASSVAQPEPAAVQPRRRSPKVSEFVSTVRVAAPAEGSFIWTVVVPISELIEDEPSETLPLSEAAYEPYLNTFSRQVTLRMYRASLVARQACDEVRANPSELLSPFLERVQEGVSANICEALVEAGGGDKTPFELSFAWSMHRPGPRAERVLFSADHLHILENAATELRTSIPERDVTIKGYVVRLTRKSSQRPGQITISGMPQHDVSDRIGYYWLELADEDYDNAVRAHGDSSEVLVTGDLIRRGNSRWLDQARNFSILPDPQAGDHVRS